MKSTLAIEGISVEIEQKSIKNLHLTVRPPHGTVRISAPYHMDMEKVMNFVRSKLDWIRKHQTRIKIQPWEPPLQYFSGEFHLLFGKKYLLNVLVHNGTPYARLNSDTIELYVRPRSGKVKRKQVLEDWYRDQLNNKIPAMIAHYEPLMSVKVSEWRIRKMKTKWGTCNISLRRIWLNLELATKPIHCIEHVVVHEMVHLLERRHNARFKGFMDRYYPEWRKSKAVLNGKVIDPR